MKTSNKIILGIFVLGFGLLSAAQVALHVKFIRSDYITVDAYEDAFYNVHKPMGIKHVKLNGLAECHIMAGDAVKLALEKSSVDYVRYSTEGDTLIVRGSFPTGHPGNFRINRSSQNVRLYLPEGIDISAVNTNVDIRGTVKQADAYNYTVALSNSYLTTRANSYRDSLYRYFNTINIQAANNSGVILYERDHFNTLNAALDSSEIQDRYALTEHINLTADKKSTIVLCGDNMKKLNSTVKK